MGNNVSGTSSFTVDPGYFDKMAADGVSAEDAGQLLYAAGQANIDPNLVMQDADSGAKPQEIYDAMVQSAQSQSTHSQLEGIFGTGDDDGGSTGGSGGSYV